MPAGSYFERIWPSVAACQHGRLLQPRDGLLQPLADLGDGEALGEHHVVERLGRRRAQHRQDVAHRVARLERVVAGLEVDVCLWSAYQRNTASLVMMPCAFEPLRDRVERVARR